MISSACDHLDRSSRGLPVAHPASAVQHVFACYVVLLGFFFSYLPFQFLYDALHLPTYTVFAFACVVALWTATGLIRTAALHRPVSALVTAPLLYIPFAGYALVSLSLSPDSLAPPYSVIGLFILIPMFMLFGLLSAPSARWSIRTIIVMGSIYIACGMYNLLSGSIHVESRLQQSIFGIDLVGRYHGEYQSESLFLGLTVVCMIIEANASRSFFLRVGVSFLAICATVLMVVGGGRSGLLTTSLCTAAWAVSHFKAGRRLRWVLQMAMGLAALWLLAGLIVGEWDLTRTVMFSRMEDAAAQTDQVISRAFLASKAVELWLNTTQNFLFGAGYGNFAWFIGVGKVGWYPHNFVLQMLAELGVVGSVLWLIPFAYIALHCTSGTREVQDRREDRLWLPVLYLWIGTLSSGDIGNAWMEVFFTMLWLGIKVDPRPIDSSSSANMFSRD